MVPTYGIEGRSPFMGLSFGEVSGRSGKSASNTIDWVTAYGIPLRYPTMGPLLTSSQLDRWGALDVEPSVDEPLTKLNFSKVT